MRKKKKSRVKTRHKIITALALPFFYLYSKIKYGVKLDKRKIDKRQYLIVSNHQTPFDQFFVSMLLKRAVYFVATEDLYQKGFLSKLLRFAVAPIPIKKNSTDINAVLSMMRVAKEGGSIAIFPEGNRTYSGKTGNIKTSIGGLIGILKFPVMVLNIKGGFAKHPRFSTHIRKGKMSVEVFKIIEYDEYKNLTSDECYELIKRSIDVNDYDYIDGNRYPDKRSAEFIERAMYVCPNCGISKFLSEGQTVTCQSCGLTVRYDERLMLSSKSDFPFKRICDWYDYQEVFMTAFDLMPYFNAPLYEESGNLVLVKMFEKPKIVIENAKISLFSDRYEFAYENDIDAKKIFYFKDVEAATAQGKNVLVFYHGGANYQVRSHEHFNVLIFVNVYYHYINNLKGDSYEKPSRERGTSREFLGL